MTTIRDRQNMEMLDVWKNLNSQVFDRTKRQIAVFPQSVKPKTERDLTVEVNTDKSIEQLNKTFESKLGALESMVQLLQLGNRVEGATGLVKAPESGTFSSLYQATVNTGDVIPLWNQIVRYYQQQGLSRDSQEIVKVKTQELKPNLDALTYGVKKAIDFIFENKNVNAGQALKIMELLRVLSIYTMIMSQVDDGSLGLISNFELETAYKNSFSSLSSNELEILKLYAPRGSITTNAIRNIPDFSTTDAMKRIKQIEDELGIRLPADYSRVLRQLPITDLNKEVDKLLQEKDNFSTFRKQNDKTKKYVAKLSKLYRNEAELVQKARELAIMYITVRQNIVEITNERLNDRYTVESGLKLREVPSVPSSPFYPTAPINSVEFVDEMIKYEEDMNIHNFMMRDRMRIIQENYYNKRLGEMKEVDDIDEYTEELEEEAKNLDRAYASVVEELDDTRMNIRYYSMKQRELGKSQSGIDEKIVNTITANIEELDSKRRPLRPNIQAQAEELGAQSMSGQGKNVDTRGLATLRSNYGKPESESDSESEEESESDLDFDDSRNEHYYTKPKSMR